MDIGRLVDQNWLLGREEILTQTLIGSTYFRLPCAKVCDVLKVEDVVLSLSSFN